MGGDNKPGRVIYATLPIRRIGEGLLFASRFAETFEDVDQIALHCRFTETKGSAALLLPPHQFPLDYPLVLREGHPLPVAQDEDHIDGAGYSATGTRQSC